MMNIRSCIAAVFGLLFSSSLFSQEWEWMSVLKSYESVLEAYLYKEAQKDLGRAHRDSLQIVYAYELEYLGNSITKENVSDLSFLDSLLVLWTGDEIDKGSKRPFYTATFASGKKGCIEMSLVRGRFVGGDDLLFKAQTGLLKYTVVSSKCPIKDFLERHSMDVVFTIRTTDITKRYFLGLKNNELYGIVSRLDTVCVYSKDELLTTEVWNMFGKHLFSRINDPDKDRVIAFDLSLYDFSELACIADRMPENWNLYLHGSRLWYYWTSDDKMWKIL